MPKRKMVDFSESISMFAESPGYLEKTGWVRSAQSGEVVDAEGNPLPWFTYPAIAFLGEHVRPAMRVFEYGSGNSTFWWHRNVSRLVSCEHDKEFFAQLKQRLPEDISYLLRRAKGGDTAYSDEITRYRDEFDILVIDGRDRIACAMKSLGALRQGGVIIWDNSDRVEYEDGFRFLAGAGFRRLDFHGLGALSTRGWCTSIFYRMINCFEI